MTSYKRQDLEKFCMDIVRIEKVNLVDAVYTQLRELLVSGRWPEGTKIPSENELCRDFLLVV